MDLKRINDHVSVSGQIQPEDVAALKARGFVAIINNRPDGEAPDQPAGPDIEAAVRAAGLVYHAIPFGRDAVTPEMIARMRTALEGSAGPVLCFCRSGMRSTTLWALSQAGMVDANEIIRQAALAGYDISRMASQLCGN